MRFSVSCLFTDVEARSAAEAAEIVGRSLKEAKKLTLDVALQSPPNGPQVNRFRVVYFTRVEVSDHDLWKGGCLNGIVVKP